ncbi:hypothetical protein EW026_g5785 [Hermanssonia centrifuga]|uniref:glutathione transferase n=2 Tax=Hermanssonia centrifuga TaxID=98765 RepID=A0A2R6NLN8_9APHY|nr:hypothetical protein PHLCEN_2v10881 [Hermanssonia centrifuga]THG95957.1 hypothetical protein EW026_g5785 [Hermanssonia centrifuga]
MVLKLIGSPGSTCTRRVATILKEKNVPYELIAVDMAKAEHKSPSHLEKQPFGQVPIIDDDGFILFESRAIARYIALKYRDQGTPLLPDPTDLKAVGKFEQAASIELSNFDPFASGLAAEKVFKPNKGIPTNEDTVKFYAATLSTKLNGYEAILSKQKYLAGDEITVADLFHLPYGAFLEKLGYSYLVSGEYPNVTRWWTDITSRPSWQAVKDHA